MPAMKTACRSPEERPRAKLRAPMISALTPPLRSFSVREILTGLGPASFSTEVHARLTGKRGTWAMAFKIEITPRNDPSGATAYAVIVTIDDHETVLSFESKEAAESFAETERARLTADEQKTRCAPPT